MRAAPLMLFGLLLGCGDKSTDTADGAAETGDPTGDDAGGGEDGGGTGGEDGGGTGGDAGGGEDGGGTGGEDGGGTGGEDGGGDDGGDDGGPEPLALLGAYFDDEGNEHVISETQWLVDFGSSEQYSYAITSWDNADGWVVGENAAGNVGEEGFWSRFDFVIDGGGSVYMCQSTGTAADEQAALDATPADASGAPASDCAYWGWRRLTPR